MSPVVKCDRLGTSVLAALVALSVAAGCYDVVDPATGSGLLSLTASVDTGTADGATLTPILVTVDPTLSLNKRVVTIRTTAGTLSGKTIITVNPDSSGRATAFLQAPRDTSVAWVSASAGDTVGVLPRTIEVTYHRAQAEWIDVIPDSFYLKPGITSSRTITAHLQRTFGKPSPGLRVTFTASNDTSGVLLTTPLPSDSSGVVTVRYTSLGALFQGPVTIRAQVQSDTATGQCVVWVVP